MICWMPGCRMAPYSQETNCFEEHFLTFRARALRKVVTVDEIVTTPMAVAHIETNSLLLSRRALRKYLFPDIFRKID